MCTKPVVMYSTFAIVLELQWVGKLEQRSLLVVGTEIPRQQFS